MATIIFALGLTLITLLCIYYIVTFAALVDDEFDTLNEFKRALIPFGMIIFSIIDKINDLERDNGKLKKTKW